MATEYGKQPLALEPGRLGATLDSWRYHAPGPRDIRLDLLRGLCLVIMIIDHIGGPSWLHGLTGGNRFYTSAAEGFVFISGLLIGSVYRATMARNGFDAGVRKAFGRAKKIYLLMIVLTVLLLGLAWLAGVPWRDAGELQSPLRFAWDLVTLRRSFFLTDILVMYTLLIVGAPLCLWMLRRGRWRALLAGSWALWLAYQLDPNVAGQPFPDIAIFHPAAWQIFFVHAVAIGYHRKRIARALTPRRIAMIAVAATLVLVALLVVFHSDGGALAPWLSDPAATVHALARKESAGPLRLLAALAVFPLAYLLATYLWQPLTKPLGWLLLPLGERSLYAYTMHLPLVILFLVLLPDSPGATLSGSTANALAQITAVLIVWLMVKYRVLFGIVPQ